VHELSITRNIVAIVSEAAAGRRVTCVRLEIGKLSAVMPDAVRFCFDVCAQGTVLEGARLEIDAIEGRGLCNQCGSELELNQLAGRCSCGSRDIRQVAGSELNVKEMEVC
jgi:hydrogenase nickel incorporation protein HypA/HybF